MTMEIFRNYRVSYLEDRAIFPGLMNFWPKCWLVAGVLTVLLLPLLLENYWIYTINLGLIAVIGAIGLNLLTGCSGQISLAHASFLALGAYTTAFLGRYGLPLYLVIPVSGAVAALVGSLVVVPAVRLRGLYLALATLAFSAIIDFLIRKADFLTGGAVGTHVESAKLFGLTVKGERSFYYLVLVIAAISALFAKNLERSKVGRAMMAIRDSDIAAEMAGISVFWTKLTAFAISSFLAGVAGSLLAYNLQYINPDNFGLAVSVSYVAMIIVGGLGTVIGSVFGALFMVFLPEVVRVTLHAASGVFPELNVAASGAFAEGAIYGLVIIIFLMFKPEGLARFWHDLLTYFRSWPFTY